LKYLTSFHASLVNLREEMRLTQEDVARLCHVDESVVSVWEATDASSRCYPSLDNLIDLCFGTHKPLEFFLDAQIIADEGQLDLPGLNIVEQDDLQVPLEKLSRQIERLVPTEEEVELLRRFRNSDPESRKLIIQLMTSG